MEETETPEEELKSGFFARLKSGLQKTRSNLAGGIENIVQGKAKVGPELLDELEETLLIADVGMETTAFILEDLK
ncbi:MAG: signal recognition particle-docking protein FtsY, partial [Nitrospina sp.]|nr:signal recognition particle-docking protein FtsY [Nitrospina sp.]